MITQELLLTVCVAIAVFGPTKLPMLARHLGKLFRQLSIYKAQAINFWQAQLNEQQLKNNLDRAEKAEKAFRQDKDKE